MRLRGVDRGFTLIELLVVIANIAVLAVILFPVFVRARANARMTACMANLRQLGIAVKQYHSDWKNLYTPAAGYWPNYPNGIPSPLKSFVYLLEPYCAEKTAFFCAMGTREVELERRQLVRSRAGRRLGVGGMGRAAGGKMAVALWSQYLHLGL